MAEVALSAPLAGVANGGSAPRIAGPFASLLEANRDDLNGRVADTLAHVPAAEREAVVDSFSEVLAGVVAPIVASLAGQGLAVGDTGVALFDAALSLCAQQRFSAVQRAGWFEVFPAASALLAAGSARVVAAIANALVNLERSEAARPADWTAAMAHAARHTTDPDQWLATGQVCAWRCGLALYRPGALAVAAGLPEALLDIAIPGAAGRLDRLVADPWFDPAFGGQRPGWRRVGGFRGFGGPFLRPPLVDLDGDDIVATDGEDWWLLRADAFGSAIVRTDPPSGWDPSAAARRGAVWAALTPARLAMLPEVTSWVAGPAGLAATSGLSHDVLFVTDPGTEGLAA